MLIFSFGSKRMDLEHTQVLKEAIAMLRALKAFPTLISVMKSKREDHAYVNDTNERFLRNELTAAPPHTWLLQGKHPVSERSVMIR